MEKIRVLVIFANPKGSDPLRLSVEDKVIHECVALSKHREHIELDVRHAATIHDVRRALLEKDYQIVHFSGHGTGRGRAFENEIGEKQTIPQEAFAEFMSAYSPPIKCIILNACYSNFQGRLIAQNVPFVIGMNAAISDSGAIEFTRGFYDAIGAGKDVEFAYEEGCRAIKLMGLPDGATPVLFSKPEKRQPMTAAQIHKRYEDRIPVEYAIRLMPKEDFQENGLLGKEERKYVFVADYVEQRYRPLRQILANLWVGDAFDRVASSNVEWIAIIFEVGELNRRKLDLMPATWKAVFRILSDPKRLGCITMSEEERIQMGSPPRDYYDGDQAYWYTRLTKPDRKYFDPTHSLIRSYFGISWLCFQGGGITYPTGQSSTVSSRVFFVKNVPLSILNYRVQELGLPNDGIFLE